jgi:alkylhydroperoxidase/carboxymuconolactone decarboxylase family protein YurZ
MARRQVAPTGKKSGTSRKRGYPDAPQTYDDFVRQFPRLAEAWEVMGKAGEKGPLDRKTTRLIKLSIAIGAMREGAVHASTRKALSMGITRKEIEQVLTLAAGTLGLPSTVAVFSWIRDELERDSSTTRSH